MANQIPDHVAERALRYSITHANMAKHGPQKGFEVFEEFVNAEDTMYATNTAHWSHRADTIMGTILFYQMKLGSITNIHLFIEDSSVF